MLAYETADCKALDLAMDVHCCGIFFATGSEPCRPAVAQLSCGNPAPLTPSMAEKQTLVLML